MNTEKTTSSENTPTSGIALGVTGSIAAYKAAELTSRLKQLGFDVHVVMTENAAKLVQPQTFFTLSRNPVTTDLWTVPEWNPEHIAIAERTDLLVIAPATANYLGKLANGIADDALSTLSLAHPGPILIAPAMHPGMWAQPAVQNNVRILQERNVRFIGPATGTMACGTSGKGRMSAPEDIVTAILSQTAGQRLREHTDEPPRRIVVTAGPTQEYLDPVRYFSNRSSGKMGYGIAAVAAAAGYSVTLISGPTALTPPPAVHCRYVQTAEQMYEAVQAEFEETDILIMTAAVADYRPAYTHGDKQPKDDTGLQLELEPTPDILARTGATKRDDQLLVGFAAETTLSPQRARSKLQRKNVDILIANDVSRDDIGFDADSNEATVFFKDGSTDCIEKCPKSIFAEKVLEIIKTKTKNR